MSTDALSTVKKPEKILTKNISLITSPSQKKIELEHKIHIEDMKEDNTWHSCVGCTTDKRAVQYFTQIGIMGCIMIFCIYQLLRNDECSHQQTYIGLLTFLMGILCPNPKRGG